MQSLNQLSQVIRDNKWFLPYLQKNINLNEKTGVKILSELKKAWPNVHFQRIETSVGLGIPDVNCCVNGVEFWLELKVSLGKRLAITKYQKAWILNRYKAGGLVFVLQKALSESASNFTMVHRYWPMCHLPFAISPTPNAHKEILLAILQQRESSGQGASPNSR